MKFSVALLLGIVAADCHGTLQAASPRESIQGPTTIAASDLPRCSTCRGMRTRLPCPNILGPIELACSHLVDDVDAFSRCAYATGQIYATTGPSDVEPAIEVIQECRPGGDPDLCAAGMELCVTEVVEDDFIGLCTWVDNRKAPEDDPCDDFDRCVEFLQDREHDLDSTELACEWLYEDRGCRL